MGPEGELLRGTCCDLFLNVAPMTILFFFCVFPHNLMAAPSGSDSQQSGGADKIGAGKTGKSKDEKDKKDGSDEKRKAVPANEENARPVTAARTNLQRSPIPTVSYTKVSKGQGVVGGCSYFSFSSIH